MTHDHVNHVQCSNSSISCKSSMRDETDDWMYRLLEHAVRFYTEILNFISFSTISAKFLTEKIVVTSVAARTDRVTKDLVNI